MDILAEQLEAKLHHWEPLIAEQVRHIITEIMDLADQNLLDVMRSKTVEQEVLYLLNEPLN